MHRAMGIALLALFMATGARGAEVATGPRTRAMIFRFDGLSNLGLAGPNGGFGLRYYLKDRLAIRPTLSFDWDRRRRRAPAVDPDQPRSSDQVQINTLIRLEVALENHLAGPKAISPYVGAGIYGTHYDNKSEPGHLPGAPTGTVTKRTTRGTTGSVFAMLGFEWGWAESMTLGGETRFGLSVDAGKTETESIRMPDRLSDETYQYSVGFDTVSLFLSVHW
jgi:hypothetical protein